MKHQYYQDLPIYSSQNSLDETSILPGSTVAIYSSQNSLELFYLCLVDEVVTGPKETFDVYGHIAEAGRVYLQCRYLELKNNMAKKGFYHYKLLKRQAFILLSCVFCPTVNIEAGYKLSVSEYQFLCDCTF